MQTTRVKGRHGTFEVSDADTGVGRALRLYGEYSEGQVEMFSQVIEPGDTCIDVGANIGALTIPMIRLAGSAGKVIAFEPSASHFEVLRRNIGHNFPSAFRSPDGNGRGDPVVLINAAASDKRGEVPAQEPSRSLWRSPEGNAQAGNGPVPLHRSITVPAMTIDELELPRCNFVRIDADGTEIEVLDGMEQTIRRCRPFIYIENEHVASGSRLIADLVDRGYRLWWHRPRQYNVNNFLGNPDNLFARAASKMIFACPEEAGAAVEGLEEVADLRDDDEMFDREIRRYGRYVKADPEDLHARLMLANGLRLMQRTDEALEQVESILAQDPTHVGAKTCRALLALQRGKLDWDGWELRFLLKDTRLFGAHRRFDVPKWDGAATRKRLLIWSEQGFGDMIMWARVWPRIREKAPNAILECHRHLHELFTHSFASLNDSEEIRILDRALPAFDVHCPLPSAAAVMQADWSMLEMRSPYLSADSALVERWNRKEAGTSASIGICTQGSPWSERPLTRDCPPDVLAALNDFGPFFDLNQKGQFNNFADTAAAIARLELVITVDTSVAHLAGAMGKDVWLLLSFDPDWRWGLESDRTRWYPTMRIFRQPRFRDWTAVIAQVRRALEERRDRPAVHG